MADYNLQFSANVDDVKKALEQIKNEIKNIERISLYLQKKQTLTEQDYLKTPERIIGNKAEKAVNEVEKQSKQIIDAITTKLKIVRKNISPYIASLENATKNVFLSITALITAISLAGFWKYINLLKQGFNIVNKTLDSSTEAIAQLPSITKENAQKISDIIDRFSKEGWNISFFKQFTNNITNTINNKLSNYIEELSKFKPIINKQIAYDVAKFGIQTTKNIDKYLSVEKGADTLQETIDAYQKLYSLQRLEPEQFRILLQLTRLTGENISRTSAIYHEFANITGQMAPESLLELKRLSPKKDLDLIVSTLQYMIEKVGIQPRNVIQKAQELFEAVAKLEEFEKVKAEVNQLSNTLINNLGLNISTSMEDLFYLLTNNLILLPAEFRSMANMFKFKYQKLIQDNYDKNMQENIELYNSIIGDPYFGQIMNKYKNITSNTINQLYEQFSQTEEGSKWIKNKQNIVRMQNLLYEHSTEFYDTSVKMLQKLLEQGNYYMAYSIFDMETGAPNAIGMSLLGIQKYFDIKIETIIKALSDINNILTGISLFIKEVGNSIKDPFGSLTEYLKQLFGNKNIQAVKNVINKNFEYSGTYYNGLY